MKIKNGDIIEFLAISWIEPQWEFDFPTVILDPIIRYSSYGKSCESFIDDVAMDFCCNTNELKNEDISEEFNWRKWKISNLKRVCNERMNNKDIWKTKHVKVVKQKIKFYNDKNNELMYKIISTKKY